jgi:phosphoribosylformimino-5-aminoimidazole carboxamide ribonucleotide (ProFAR) isomerase
MRIIPAIDIIDGNVYVCQKDSIKIIYNENPLEVAKNLKRTALNIYIWWI